MAYLTRKFDLMHYVPLTAAFCFALMIIGMSVWVHFTVTVVNAVEYAVVIAGPTASAPNLGDISRTVVALPIIFMLFGTGIFAMILWRVWTETQADLTGQFHPWQFWYWLTSILAQMAWWAVMVVVVVDIMLDSNLVALVKDASTAVTLAVKLQRPPPFGLGRVTDPPPGLCYPQCLDLSNFGYVDVDVDQSCVCDYDTIVAINNALNMALDGTDGLMAGIWIMFISGGFLQMYLSYAFGRLEAQEDIEDRLDNLAGGRL